MIGRTPTCLRCSTCGISYPHEVAHRTCQSCGEPTAAMQAAPDEDWEEKVALEKEYRELLAAMPDDKVYGWRFQQLVRAGFSQGSAAELSVNRAIDLHFAVDLAHKAGPETAYRILH